MWWNRFATFLFFTHRPLEPWGKASPLQFCLAVHAASHYDKKSCNRPITFLSTNVIILKKGNIQLIFRNAWHSCFIIIMIRTSIVTRYIFVAYPFIECYAILFSGYFCKYQGTSTRAVAKDTSHMMIWDVEPFHRYNSPLALLRFVGYRTQCIWFRLMAHRYGELFASVIWKLQLILNLLQIY